MDGAADRCRVARERLPFPLYRAQCGAPSLHCKRASPSVRFTLSRWQAALRRIGIMRNHRLLGEAVAPEKWFGVKSRRGHGPGLRQAGRERRFTMDACVRCRRKVQPAENWLKCHLWGGFAIFHWRCFGEYLRAESEQQVESVVWKASSIASAHQRETEEGAVR
jgi:hypothetical protein